MTKEELIDRINDIEWEDFEAKEAKSELPKNIWETVSAFANTSGGWIVLGVKQNGKKFEISGVDNAEKLEQDFLGTLRSQKFNEPVAYRWAYGLGISYRLITPQAYLL
ncbi:ATP-binding protein [Prevotella copri]|nr:ATP-binding protein [Segatella copri]